VLCSAVLCCVCQVYDPDSDEDRSFGLLGDSDHLWTPDQRERQKHQVRQQQQSKQLEDASRVPCTSSSMLIPCAAHAARLLGSQH
jgi:hypothetical protein